MSTVSQIEGSAQAESVYEAQRSQSTQKSRSTANYGRTIGQPQLSEEGKAYYEELKKKYSNLDFVLVSKDMKDIAKAQAGSFANPNRLVVLIDEEKIERMATDENFRKQYEGIIEKARVQLPRMKQSLSSKGEKVKGYGLLFNDGGNASFFAVVDKSLADQRKRIARNAEKKKEEKKTEEKKDAREAAEEKRREKMETEDTVTITASSLEELLRKIDDYYYDELSDSVQTQEEMMIGQNIDFRG